MVRMLKWIEMLFCSHVTNSGFQWSYTVPVCIYSNNNINTVTRIRPRTEAALIISQVCSMASGNQWHTDIGPKVVYLLPPCRINLLYWVKEGEICWQIVGADEISFAPEQIGEKMQIAVMMLRNLLRNVSIRSVIQGPRLAWRWQTPFWVNHTMPHLNNGYLNILFKLLNAIENIVIVDDTDFCWPKPCL